MLTSARLPTTFRQGLWASRASLAVQLENVIVNQKNEKSASEKVYGSNPKWISNMRSFGEIAIVARHSDKKARNQLADRGNTVIFIGYSDHHEKDVYKFLNIRSKKPIFSRDVIWFNKTYSKQMGITQVELTAGEEEELIDAEDEEFTEDEGIFGPPQPVTMDDHIDHQVDVSHKVPNPPLIPVPYPKGSRELRILSYGTAPAPKRLARELKGLQSRNIHVAEINRQIQPNKDKEFTMLSAAFNSIAGFDDGRDIPKNYKDVLGHKNQSKWWDSMKKEFHAMESKGVWKIVPLSSMPHGKKIVGNRWVYTEKDDGTYRSRTVFHSGTWEGFH
jgi:hypothetical protein